MSPSIEASSVKGELPAIFAPHRRRQHALLVLVGLGQAVAGYQLAMTLRAALSAPARSLASAATPDEAAILWPVVLGIAAWSLVLAGLKILERGQAERLAQDYVCSTRRRLVRKALSTRRSARSLGVNMTRLTSDLSALRNWVCAGIARSAAGGVALLGYLAGLLVIHPAAGFAALAAAAVIGFAVLAMSGAMRKALQKVRSLRGGMANALAHAFDCGESIREFSRAQAETNRLHQRGRKLASAAIRRAWLSAIVRNLPEGAFPVVIGVVLLVPATSPGETVAAVILTGMIVTTLKQLVRVVEYRLAYAEAHRRLTHALAREGTSLTRRGVPGEGAMGIALTPADADDTTVRYAPPGSVVWVDGTGPEWKQRFSRCLRARPADNPYRIELNGICTSELGQRALRRIIKISSPGLPLVRRSISGNLHYGATPRDQQLTEEVSRLCGIEGPADDSSVRPSDTGGNVEPDHESEARLRLARALMTRPRLVLIDEPALLSTDESGRWLIEIARHLPTTVVVLAERHAGPLAPEEHVWRLPGQPSARPGATMKPSATNTPALSPAL